MSKRWAFMEGFQVKNPDGTPHLDRLRMIQTPLFGVYLHRIHTIDDDRDPHDHPWHFVSILLSGSYLDRVWDDPARMSRIWDRLHHRWKPTVTKRSQAHQIIKVDGQVWTLVLVGPRHKTWRFWTETGPVDWRDYRRRGEQSEPLK